MLRLTQDDTFESLFAWHAVHAKTVCSGFAFTISKRLNGASRTDRYANRAIAFFPGQHVLDQLCHALPPGIPVEPFLKGGAAGCDQRGIEPVVAVHSGDQFSIFFASG